MHPFLLWVFAHYCDSESGNHGRANDSAEYGISSADFMAQDEAGAIEDAQSYLRRLSLADRQDYVARWQADCRDRAARLTALASTSIEVETL